MNTKEAIELTKSFRNDLTDKYFKNEIEYFDSVIKLLQSGGKYEAMWEELEEYPLEYSYVALKNVIKDLRQKYFPKGDINE